MVTVSLITGAASGIGLATAKRLLERGDLLICLDSNELGLESAFGEDSRVWWSTVDVSDDEHTKVEILEGFSHWGQIDNVVTSAGVGGGSGILDGDLEGFKTILNVNLFGTLSVIRYAVQLMVDSRRAGSVVLLSSTNARAIGLSSFPYPVSKAAVAVLGRSLAVELAAHRIRVNVVAPGPIRTPLANSPAARERWDHFVARIPMGRPGEPAEVASVIDFLTSDGSSYITGAFLPVDGGLLAY